MQVCWCRLELLTGVRKRLGHIVKSTAGYKGRSFGQEKGGKVGKENEGENIQTKKKKKPGRSKSLLSRLATFAGLAPRAPVL